MSSVISGALQERRNKYNRRAELGNATFLTAVKGGWEIWESIIEAVRGQGRSDETAERRVA